MSAFPSTVKEIHFSQLLNVASGGRFLLYLGTVFYWILGRFFTQRPKLRPAASLPKVSR